VFRVRPLQDYSINEPARLVIYDNRTCSVALMQEIGVGDEFSFPFDTLQEHLDYKFKIQTKSMGRWIDRVNYARLLPESETEGGIKYLFYPSKGSEKLVVVFQAINRNPGYNYVRTLSGVNAHRLYIKDEYGTDEETHSSYYLGKGRSFDIADKVQRLITELTSSLRIERKNCIFAGSSKGGFAALYHGYRFGAGHILPGGPQVLLGNFLNSRKEDSAHPPILRYIAGGLDDESVAWANQILKEVMFSTIAPFPYTEIHVGRDEPHYRKHVLPFLQLVEKAKLPNVTVDLGDYGTHSELATHYPKFLRDRVETVILGLKSSFAS